MITTNTDGNPISQAFADAMEQPSAMYSMKLYRNGTDLGAIIKGAKLDLGAGQSSDDLGTFAACGVYQTQFSASLYDCPSILGDELEVRVGVLTGNAYEYVAVAYVTITEESVWKGVTDVRGVGRMGLMHAPHGLAEGDYQPAAIAAAIYAATGILVSIDARLTTQSVHADAGGTCRDALESMCARLGAFACELGEGVSVMPYNSTVTGTIPTGHVTGRPELGTLYEVDGITVEAGEESFVQGTGRVHIVDGTATATTAAATWGNMRGYAFTPATLNIALIDPRWTVADMLEVTLGEDDYSIPARGISITYDGGYFGTVSAAGLTAEAEEMTVEGPLTRSVGYARSVADEALEVAQATGQYFWHDDSGAHVSTEALEPEGASNSLWNSLGLLIRKAANNLVSITQSAIAFFDGNGNNSANVIASFGSTGAQIGKAAANHIEIDSDSIDLCDGSTVAASIVNTSSYVGIVTNDAVIDGYKTGGKLVANKTSGYLDLVGNNVVRISVGDSSFDDRVTVSASNVTVWDRGQTTLVDIPTDGTVTSPILVYRPIRMRLGWLEVPGTITGESFNGFRGRKSLTTTDDIDALFETGVYYIQGNGAGGTFPSGTTGAYNSLISVGGHPSTESADSWVGKQILIAGSTLYVRSYAGSPRAWSAWGEHKPYSAPTQTSTASSIFTPASGVTVTGAYYTTNGIMAQVYLTLSRSSAIAANTEVTLGTVVDGKRPKQQVNGGFGTAGSQYGNVRLLASGDVRIRATAQIAASTSFTIIFPAYMLP